MKTLADAISSVESAVTSLGNADGAQAAAQSKFDGAKVAKDNADAADGDAIAAVNQSLDELIAVAKAQRSIEHP